MVVRNLLSFRRFPTDSIEGFRPSVPYGFNFGRCGLVVRKLNGKVVHLGVPMTTPVDDGVGVGSAEAKELNEWLTALQAGVRFPAASLVPAWMGLRGLSGECCGLRSSSPWCCS